MKSIQARLRRRIISMLTSAHLEVQDAGIAELRCDVLEHKEVCKIIYIIIYTIRYKTLEELMLTLLIGVVQL